MTIRFVLLCLALGSAVLSAADDPAAPNRKTAPNSIGLADDAATILVVGDSISAGYGIQREDGWVALLERRLEEADRPYRVVNASISGDTTGAGLARLPKALELHAPTIVVIELGGNDALRGYPIADIRRNLDALTIQAQQSGARVVIAGMQIPPNYGVRYTSAFHGLFADVATTRGAALIPFLLDGVATDQRLMQDDGIHPTAAAQAQLLANAWPVIAGLL